MKELQEKQDLLCQASKALELLDEQKSNDLRRSEIRNDELIQKIESLNHEIVTLQNANKSCFGNDTGYADFLGAVDTKDIELQRANAELEEFRAQMTQLCDDMNDKIAALEVEKKDIQAKASNLLYENDEMKDKIAQFENIMTEQVRFRLCLHSFPNLNSHIKRKKFKILKDFCSHKLDESRWNQCDCEQALRTKKSVKFDDVKSSLKFVLVIFRLVICIIQFLIF